MLRPTLLNKADKSKPFVEVILIYASEMWTMNPGLLPRSEAVEKMPGRD